MSELVQALAKICSHDIPLRGRCFLETRAMGESEERFKARALRDAQDLIGSLQAGLRIAQELELRFLKGIE